eukprot:scaffold161338_cov31-Tisochrysis_lutea.AAC.2
MRLTWAPPPALWRSFAPSPFDSRIGRAVAVGCPSSRPARFEGFGLGSERAASSLAPVCQ